MRYSEAMAIIEIESTIIGIRGRQHGLVFSANLAGPYTRGRYKGANPRTERQCTVRAYLAQSAAAWLNLTAAERTAWNALGAAPPEPVYNSLGQIIVLSGFQWHAKIWARSMSVGATPPTAAPAPPTATSFVSITANINALGTPDSSFSLVEPATPDSVYAIVFMAFSQAGGAAVGYRNWKLLMTLAAPYDTDEQCQVEMELIFGKPPQFSIVSLRAYSQLANGLRSPAVETSALVG